MIFLFFKVFIALNSYIAPLPYPVLSPQEGFGGLSPLQTKL